MDIDLYEFKETLKEFENTDLKFLKLDGSKGVAVIEVGKMGKEMNGKLKKSGYKIGERVLVVVQ